VSSTWYPDNSALIWGTEDAPSFAKALSALVSNAILGRPMVLFYRRSNPGLVGVRGQKLDALVKDIVQKAPSSDKAPCCICQRMHHERLPMDFNEDNIFGDCVLLIHFRPSIESQHIKETRLLRTIWHIEYP